MPGMAAGGRILLAYLIYFAAIGAAFPYLPVFYHDIGLGLEQIGVLTALQAAIQLLLAPVWGGLADRFPHTRLTLPLAAAVATVGATILFRADDFPTVLVGSLILYAGISGIAPTLDARTLETLGTERRSRYGEVRAFGSLAFVLATLAVGFVLDAEGARALFWVYIPFLIATVVVTRDDPPPRCDPLRQPDARDRAVPGDAGGRAVPDRVHGRLGVTRRGQRVLLDPDRRPRRKHRAGRHRLGVRGEHRGPDHVRVPADRAAGRHGAARSDRDAGLRAPGAPCVAHRRSGRARPCRSARGDRVRVRLRRRRDRGRGAGAGRAPGNRAGHVRRRQRAGHDHRLGRRRGDRRARSGSPACSCCAAAREPRRDGDRGGGAAAPRTPDGSRARSSRRRPTPSSRAGLPRRPPAPGR